MRLRSVALVIGLSLGMTMTLGGPAAAEGRPFSTTLTGGAEVPGPGDPDASGTATVTLNQGLGEVCFELSWANIDGTVFAAHIHEAPTGVAGPVVVPLFVPPEGPFSGTDSTSGCTAEVDQELIKDIRHNPAGFYVNVHSTVFPAGAIRGQLSK
ncbi:MAG: CHRD domain-containing protein [Actinomycetota bacterium]